MNRATALVAQLKGFVRRHLYITIACGALLAFLGGGAIAIAKHQDSPVATPATQKKPAISPAAATDASSKPQDTESHDIGTAAAKPDTKKPAAAKPAASSQKRLRISPASITVQAGSSADITVQTEDGAAVTMPMFRGQSPLTVFLNYPAAPYKMIWSGAVGSAQFSTAGTFTMNIVGQDRQAAEYTGTVTITVLPTPHISATLTWDGYDAGSDQLLFTAKLIRHYGYSQPVTLVFGSYSNAPGPVTIECVSQPRGEDTYALACHHAYGIRPASGQLGVTISTADNATGAFAAFTLPPL